MSSKDKPSIDFELMTRIIEMMRARGYQNINFFTLSMDDNDDNKILLESSKKKAESSKKKGKGKANEIESKKKRGKQEKKIERDKLVYEENDVMLNEDEYNDFENSFQNVYVLIGEGNFSETDEGKLPDNLIYLHPTTVTGLQEIKMAYSVMHILNEKEEIKVARALIIGKEKLTPPALKELSKISKYNFEYFLKEEIRPPDSIMKSEYTILNEEETKELLEILREKDTRNLPKLLTSDPTTKYFGYPKKTVLKIQRQSVGLPTIVENTISYGVVSVGNPTFKRKDRKEVQFD